MDHKEGLLAFLPEMEAQIQAPPLCVSQYALVNFACAFTHTHPSLEDSNYDQVYLLDQDGHGENYTQVPIEPHRSQDDHGHRNGSRPRPRHGHEGGHHQRPGHGRGHNQRPGHGGGGHNHRHEHEGGRNQRPGHEYQHRSRHGRGHNHRSEHGRRGHNNNHRHEHENEHGSRHRRNRDNRRHGAHHRASEDECCKWLTELDDICVCNLLVRLPPFLSRLQHKYSIRVGDTCKVSYKCPGRNIIL